MEIIKYIKCSTVVLIMAFSGLLACKKEDAAIADYARPVVQAYLSPGVPLLVKVYYQKYLDDTISYGFPIKDLELKVSDGTNTVALTESTDGVYEYADAGFVKDKGTYSLSFSYLDKTISAQTTMPDKPIGFTVSASSQKVPVFSFGTEPEAFVPVTFKWNNNDGGYYMMMMKNIDTYPTRINTRDTRPYADSEAILGQVSTYQTQQMMFNFSGNYKVLLFRINKEYSDALNSGGGTSLNLTNPYTNVQNGLGIFTAMQADTLDLLVYQ
ncbi:DUF4249 family protein [Pedobacter hiemivivus]|uniref:DUF4249 family protein n=1 Tax=Pedobacter hiemivivus TaxID=2530454 RepID=A0A4R0NA48_9SPHI|nr:DUF4249 family protein [Pedobacter hiemivivus]TCC97108.1 DUF4249 family protein [Pedobacter hiemivivus]